MSSFNWIEVDSKLPEPFEEVLVWIDGHRNPAWRNNHALVAYMDGVGDWWEERHASKGPLAGVLKWCEIDIPND